MSGQAPDAKAWAEYHARQAAARAWAQSQAAGTSVPTRRAVLPPPVADPRQIGLQAAAQAQTANQQAWQNYQQQQAAHANAEAWRQYYAANPAAAAAAGVAQPTYAHPGMHHPGHGNMNVHAHHAQPPPAPSAHHGPVSHHYAQPTYHAHPSVPLANNTPIVGAAVANAARGMASGGVPSYAAASHTTSSQGANSHAQNNKGNSQWPPALKAYVERCFASCRSDESTRPFVTKRLKKDIAEATKTGALWTTDWDARAPPRVAMGNYPGPEVPPPPPASQVPKLVYGRPRVHTLPDAEMSGDDTSEPITPRGFGKKLKKNPLAKQKSAKRSLDDDLTPGELAKRQRRMGRFGDGTAEGASEAATKAAELRRERLSNLRFVSSSSPAFGGSQNQSSNDGQNSLDLDHRETVWDEFTVKGSCVVLEKSYFRLTSAPDPKTVRPANVLRKALQRLQSEEVTNPKTKADKKTYNYHYLTDQLKAMRQDLVVQRIRNEFTVSVYEHHARVALRNDDLGEFNQCQTVLRELYKEIEGDTNDGDDKVIIKNGLENSFEFLAYRVLYGAVTDATGPEFVGVLGEAANCVAKVVTSKNKDKIRIVAHALAARAALAETNVCEWFRLSHAAELNSSLKDSKHLMRQVTPTIRFVHLTAAAKAFRPNLSVAFLAKTLGFTWGGELIDESINPSNESKFENSSQSENWRSDGAPRVSLAEPSDAEIEVCADWLTAHGAVLVTEDDVPHMDGKASVNTLFVPEDRNAVAHGDQTLDIDDFLAKAVG